MSLGVVLFAGGRGVRLRAVTGDAPKALAPLGPTTLLDYQLDRIAALRPAAVVVLAGHNAQPIVAAVGDRATVEVEDVLLGTAGGLHRLPDGPDRWLSLNVDHVSDVDLAAFAAAARPPCTACLWEAAVSVDEGVVDLDGDRLVGWQERPVLRLPVTTGLYLFSADALRRHLTGAPLDMPDLVRRMMPEGVHAWMHRGMWVDAGTPARLEQAARWLAARRRDAAETG